MANYNGMRGPNVSEFIANLNAIPPAQDMANQESFNLDDDLAMFTNTQFFDFDVGHDADLQPSNFDFNAQSRGQNAAHDPSKGMDFTQGEFSFPDFNAFSQPQAFPNDGRPIISRALQNAQPIYPSSPNAASPQSGMSPPHVGDKCNADAITNTPYAASFDDESRVAAEEDKRRRNTAASARFRVKKKQREQALEKSAKEMADKVAAFELRISQLETENKWLKNLITEKNDSKDNIAALWKKYREESAEREASERKDGVGTGKA
ncbi:MAG: hypothetical protein M1818_008368 [Claussenomyces sp. TS43310]|nr:MAG: hypothetical protein M1818_008368 [Claussenomyces sp. TS43310]